MYIDDDITVDEIDAVSGTLTVGKINSKIDGTNTRSFIHFTKYSLSSGFDDLDIDIKLKGKTDPQTTIYVVVYGVKGQVNNVPVNLWDRFYFYDNTSLKYEVPIDMNNKNITGVRKIATFSMSVDNHIDMKNHKIINLDDAKVKNDAINKGQLDAVETQFELKFATVNNQVTQNKNDIATINTNNYYHFTDQLKHDNTNTVKFPAINSHIYSAVDNSEYLKITQDGHYQIIYADYCQQSGYFTIHDDTNGNDLFVLNINNTSNWSPITINAVVSITVDNGFNYARIKMNIQNGKPDINPILDGRPGYSTFFIKYLNSFA